MPLAAVEEGSRVDQSSWGKNLRTVNSQLVRRYACKTQCLP